MKPYCRLLKLKTDVSMVLLTLDEMQCFILLCNVFKLKMKNMSGYLRNCVVKGRAC